MSIDVTILGCGSATPTVFRNPTSQWLDVHGNYILLDCGEGTQVQLLKHRLKMSKLKAICISHLHGDHFFGLPGLISSMHLMGRKSKLLLIGPPELFTLLELMFKFSQTELRFPLEFIPVVAEEAPQKIDFASFTIETVALNHRIPTTGFIIREKPRQRHLIPEMLSAYNIPQNQRNAIKRGEDFISENGEVIPNRLITKDPSRHVSYAFCSDTAPDPTIVQAIQGVTALYHEATFEDELSDRAKDTFHSTATQAALQAKEAHVEHLYLGHFSSRYQDTNTIVHQARRVFKNSSAVEDGFSFKVM